MKVVCSLISELQDNAHLLFQFWHPTQKTKTRKKKSQTCDFFLLVPRFNFRLSQSNKLGLSINVILIHADCRWPIYRLHWQIGLGASCLFGSTPLSLLSRCSSEVIKISLIENGISYRIGNFLEWLLVAEHCCWFLLVELFADGGIVVESEGCGWTCRIVYPGTFGLKGRLQPPPTPARSPLRGCYIFKGRFLENSRYIEIWIRHNF